MDVQVPLRVQVALTVLNSIPGRAHTWNAVDDDEVHDLTGLESEVRECALQLILKYIQKEQTHVSP